MEKVKRVVPFVLAVCLALTFSLTNSKAQTTVLVLDCEYCDGDYYFTSATDWVTRYTEFVQESDGTWWLYIYSVRTATYICNYNSAHILQMNEYKTERQFSGY